MENKGYVLFVDDEPHLLKELHRMLAGQRPAWEMSFVSGGQEALEHLATGPCDLIVTDMNMPGMDGIELLEIVAQLYPETIRVILSEQADRGKILRALGPTHQYLTKPCDPEALEAILARAQTMLGLLRNQPLRELLARIDKLPSLPLLYTEIMTLARSPDASLWEIGEIVSQDPAMAAKVLQLVNSAYFRRRAQISDIHEAVILLGLETIQKLALSVGIFSQFPADYSGISLERLWTHSLTVATYSRAIAEEEGLPRTDLDEYFLAGLLHDIGKLILATNFPREYRNGMMRVTNQETDLLEMERSLFGATHAEIGAYMMGLWGLPAGVVDAIAFHHERAHPSDAPPLLAPTTAVKVADLFANHASRPAASGRAIAERLGRDFLSSASLQQWWRSCAKVRQQMSVKP